MVKKDIYRYYGKEKLTFIEKLKIKKELKLIIAYRKAQSYNKVLL